MQQIGILIAIHPGQLVMLGLLLAYHQLSIVANALDRGLSQCAKILDHCRAGHSTAVHSRKQRVSTQTVSTVIHIITLTGSKKTGDTGLMLPINVDTAHKVVYGRENLHRNFMRVIAVEGLVNIHNTFQTAIQIIVGQMAQIQIYLIFAVNAKTHIDANVINLTRSNITGHQISIGRITLLQEVPRFAVFISPDTRTVATGRLRHQAVFVITGHSGRVDLDKLTVSVGYTVLIKDGCRRAGIDDRVSRTAVNHTCTAGSDNYRISNKILDLHSSQILCYNAFADAVVIEDQVDHFPVLVFGNETENLLMAHLLIQSIKQLLTGGGTGKSGTFILNAAETTQIQQALAGSGKLYTHSVHCIDQTGSILHQTAYRRLVSQKVAAVNSIIKMLVNTVVLTFGIQCRINAALRTDGVRALHRHQRDQIDRDLLFSYLQCGHQTGQTAADNHNLGFFHIQYIPLTLKSS